MKPSTDMEAKYRLVSVNGAGRSPTPDPWRAMPIPETGRATKTWLFYDPLCQRPARVLGSPDRRLSAALTAAGALEVARTTTQIIYLVPLRPAPSDRSADDRMYRW